MLDSDGITERIKSLSGDDRKAFEELLEGNGLSEDTVATRSHDITEIEMFLFNFPRMVCFDLFPHLTQLTITQQAITKIENLHACPNLEKLWLNENSIESMQGLEACSNLKRLYLYSNRIRRIQGLQACKQLEVLWLADNQIVVVEGLEGLVKLRELNLARNQVDQIGDVFSANSALECLNLADNHVGAFKEVCYLARLPNLVDLCFSDPHWGECPFAGLCNYQTYVLFNLQQLTSLDTLVLSDETKQLAEATYMKKKMYYNMRIKTLRRNTSNAIRKANQGRTARVGTAVAVLNLLRRQLKGIAGELAEAEHYEHYIPKPGVLEGLREKASAIRAVMAQREAEVRAAATAFEECKQRVHELCNDYVRRMMVELETGGNIRMEDGKPSDLWYSSCVDLVNSRFFASDFAAIGIKGLKVSRVTRIHNRFLRNRFEERLETLVDVSDPTYKRSLEYLFYGESPALPGELLTAAEDGFRHASEYAAMGLDGAVTLSNSISIADSGRLSAALDSSARKRPTARSPLHGQVLVAKVFLGKCVQESALPATARAKAPPPVSKADFPECNSVFRVKQTDQKQRLWYVFEHTLVLPEYLVEYEYDTTPACKLRTGANVPILDSEGQAALDGLDFDIRLIARPLVPLLLAANAAELDDNGNPVVKLSGKESGMEVINSGPQLEQKPKVYQLTSDVLQRHIGTTSLATVTYLNLHGNAIRKIEGLAVLPALRTLLLSFNELQKMEGLSDLNMLERLDLSYNSIRRIEGLKGVASLRVLELNNNLLHRLDDVNVLKKYVPNLETVDLSSNPICSHKTYRTLLLRRLSAMTSLDGEEVTREDREAASDNTSTLTIQVIKENSFSRRSTSTAVAGISAADQGADDDTWWRHVEELVVEHKRVRRLQNLDRLSSLRRASFVDNELTRLEGLEQCGVLEELSVEDNRIMAVDGLSRCRMLKKLELGRNKISRLENLETLTQLTQLSVEDNEIESLAGIATLSCLMELYIGNNRISQLREILHLKDHPKLIILDLLGNPLCKEDDYRMYTIYQLKKLKVLDGAGIEAGEQSLAKNKYAGRLTIETLESKVGHRTFDRLRELDINGLRIRDVANCFQLPDFSGLQEINLDNNLMSEVQGLAHLPHLSVLRLGANRIGDGCRFDINPLGSSPPFPALQVLQLGQNCIASIERLGLNCLTGLRSLFLQGNDITRVDGLDGLVMLQELVLDRNRIKYVDPTSFLGLPNLRELRLEENGLRSLANLNLLERLSGLYLGYNRVADPADLDRLVGLTQLVEINLTNNPVVRKQVYRAVLLGKLPSLRMIDGREVTVEERDYVLSMFAPQPPMETMASMGMLLGGNNVGPPAGGGGSKVPVKMTALNFDSSTGMLDPRTEAIMMGRSDGSELGGPSATRMELGGGLGVTGQSRGLMVPRPVSNNNNATPPGMSMGYVIGGRAIGPTGSRGSNSPARQTGSGAAPRGGMRQTGGYSSSNRRG